MVTTSSRTALPSRACLASLATRCALGATAVAALLSSDASRAAGPIIDDLDGATPLWTEVPAPPAEPSPTRPEAEPPSPAQATTTAPRAAAEAHEEDRSREAIVASGRWIGLPDGLLGAFFETHPSFSQGSVALAYETGPTDGKVWSFEAGWLPLIPRGGNWQTRLSAPASTLHVVSDLHMLSLDATYRSQYEAGPVRLFFGGGFGVALLVGDVTTDEVLPDCVAPSETCAHWPTASRKTVDLPTRILPVLHLTSGLEVDLGDTLSLRIAGGFRDVLYLGLGLGAQL